MPRVGDSRLASQEKGEMSNARVSPWRSRHRATYRRQPPMGPAQSTSGQAATLTSSPTQPRRSHFSFLPVRPPAAVAHTKETRPTDWVWIDLRASRDADLLPNPAPNFSLLISPCEATGGCRRHGGDPSDGLGVIDARASRDADARISPAPKFSFLISPCEATSGCRRHEGDPSDGLGGIDARVRPGR